MNPTAGTETRSRPLADPSQIELIIAQIESLPTLSTVAVQLLELASDDRSGARDLVRLIEADQSLTAGVLATARRANRGAAAETVSRAVAVLGFNAVRNLALSIEVFETFSHQLENGSQKFDRLAFWKHSLAVGCAAKLLAETKAWGGSAAGAPAARPEEAFCCGLLHDIGKVVLSACFPKTYDRVIEEVDTMLGDIADVERSIFGLDHALAGRRLAAHWKLPAMVGECIWLHHHTPASTPTQIAFPHHVRLVQAADELVRQMRIGYSGTYRRDVAGSALTSELPAGQAEFERVKHDLPELVETRAEIIGLADLTPKEMYKEAFGRVQGELTQINARLAETNRRLERRSRCLEALQKLKEGLDEEPAHEHVCRAAVEAVRVLTGPAPVAVLACSPRRAIVVMAAGQAEGVSVRLDGVPGQVAGDMATLATRSAGWGSVEVLGAAVLDRLAATMATPARTCWGFGHPRGAIGAIVLGIEPEAGLDEAIAVLADWLATWLHGVEARVLAGRLNEELADMNRRLVDTQAEVARIRSLAMVGEMAGGAAHELNNPLAVISGRAQMLAKGNPVEETRRSAEVIAEHAHKASAIVTELMEFAKPAPPAVSVWSLRPMLAELRREWIDKGRMGADSFQVVLSDDVPLVRADAVQMQKLFDELIRNAVEALHGMSEPKLIVNCRADVADEKVVVRIEDNGVGMSPEVLERAMDPFFSSQPAGRRRGLGLSRAARYAEINGGSIRLSSRPTEGTVVLVSIPAAVEAQAGPDAGPVGTSKKK